MTLSGYAAKISSPWAESDRNLMKGDDHRGGGRMKSLTEMAKRYIAFNIGDYELATRFLDGHTPLSYSDTKSIQRDRHSALWSIANTADLFGDELQDTLTDDQWNATLDFIEQFQGGQV